MLFVLAIAIVKIVVSDRGNENSCISKIINVSMAFATDVSMNTSLVSAST